MKEKLSVIERRRKILDYIAYYKQTTCMELSKEFFVSLSTIWRDIVFISRYEPIYCQKGRKGGVFILPNNHNFKYYLSEEEEILLISLLDKVEENKIPILKGIIIRFSRGTLSNK
ncbi:MAG: HTH domain-containing protein [Firmicutes bacterium]|nr:HTH domain-containing protein [Bacillota bacterium]